MKLGLETEEQTLKIIEKLNFVIENFKSHFENKKANFRGDNNKESLFFEISLFQIFSL